MIEALDALAVLADHVLRRARQSTDALTLAQTIKALEPLTATVEVLHHLSVAMTGQATRLRDQEAAIQPDGQALCAMDTALVHLTCGQETMMTAHHLLASGRHELHTAAEERNRGERPDQGPPPPPWSSSTSHGGLDRSALLSSSRLAAPYAYPEHSSSL